MIVASLVKVSGSKWLGWKMTLISVAIGIGAASAFTRSALNALGFDPAYMTIPVAAVIAIGAEQTARQLQNMSLKEVLALWKGKS